VNSALRDAQIGLALLWISMVYLRLALEAEDPAPWRDLWPARRIAPTNTGRAKLDGQTRRQKSETRPHGRVSGFLPCRCRRTGIRATHKRQCRDETVSPAFSRYTVPQYGHLASPVRATSR
jgi:hypothetical protein